MASLVERNKRYYVVYTYEDEKGEKKQKWEGFTARADAVRRKSEVEYRKEQLVAFDVFRQCKYDQELHTALSWGNEAGRYYSQSS